MCKRNQACGLGCRHCLLCKQLLAQQAAAGKKTSNRRAYLAVGDATTVEQAARKACRDGKRR